ncbi:MAG: class I SAM-dependent methyltransferase [Anaerolineae bacterium]|nr:class I SAM-dependent methyltransferase [Anaerolineae bacterium]
MPYDYDALYQEQRHALGEPTQAFVDFFKKYDRSSVQVLDLGCGQGRDALFIARLGHHVTGVDVSPTGIEQLLADAKNENLAISGLVADLCNYSPDATFDVVVIDRTLHMLDAEPRLDVLRRILPAVKPDGYILIADEKSNLPAMHEVFAEDDALWTSIKDARGFLFMQKV